MSLPVDITASDARLAYIYARRFDLRLRAPDALHLAIACRLDATLVTLDRRLAEAARELGVRSRTLAIHSMIALRGRARIGTRGLRASFETRPSDAPQDDASS